MANRNAHWNFATNEDGQLVITVTVDPLPSGSIFIPPVTMTRRNSLYAAAAIINNRMVTGEVDATQPLGVFVQAVIAKEGDL